MATFRIDVVVDPARAKQGTRVVERNLGRIENKADQVRASLSRMLGPLLAGSAIFQGVRTLASFEQGIANVGAISSATADQLVALRDVAQELGATTRFTAVQATEGLTFLARAGFEVADSIDLVDDTLRLAQVGILDLGSAADIATNVLAGFNLGVEDATRFVDVLAKTSTSANTDVRQLGDAFKLVAPVAAGVRVSLEETAGAIGILSNAGLQATLAGTGLRRVISELESPAEKTQNILREMGLTVNDVRISSVGLQAAMERLNEGGLTAAQALEIFGQRGGPAAIVLSKTTDATKELTKELENAEGFAQLTAEAMDDNLQGSLLKVKSAFEAVILAAGGAGTTGGLRGVLDGLADGLRFLAANADTLITAAGNLAIILGPKYLLGAVRALTVAMAANPFGLIAVGAALLISLIPDLQSEFMSLIKTVGELGTALIEQIDFRGIVIGAAVFVDQTVALFDGMIAAISVLFGAIPDQSDAVWELVLLGVRNLAEGMLDFFGAAAQTIVDTLLGIGNDAILVIENVGGAIGALSAGNLAAAESFGDNIESALLRTGARVTSFTKVFNQNLSKLQAVEILPEVELSNEARELGEVVADHFRSGMEESNLGAAEAVEQLLGPRQEMVEVAGEIGEQIAEAVVDPLEGLDLDPESITLSLTETQRKLRDSLDLSGQLAILEADLNAILAERPDLINEANQAMLDFQIKALEASTSFEDGVTRAFLKMRKEAENLSAVAEDIVNVFADQATDAIVEFAETGEFSFREFSSSILKELLRIIARLLIVKALSAALSASGGGALGSAAGSIAGGLQEGGTVQPGRRYIVGENGPEIFEAERTGTIIPNERDQPQAAPEVKVQVVNVQDPNEVPQAISDGTADEAVINLLARNKDRVRQVVQ